MATYNLRILTLSALAAVSTVLGACTDQLPDAPPHTSPLSPEIVLTEVRDDTAYVVNVNVGTLARTNLFPGAIFSAPRGGNIAFVSAGDMPGGDDSTWAVGMSTVRGAGKVIVASGKRRGDGVERLDGMSVVIAPSGQRVVYATSIFNQSGSDTRKLYAVNANGTGRIQLATGINSETTPAFSPDGSSVAYYGDGGLYVVSSTGGVPRKIADSTHAMHDGYSWLEWSPQGDRIAYVGYNAAGNDDIYTIKSDGTDKRNLTNDVDDNFWPVWSPDGSRLAYVGGDDEDVILINADGTGRQNLTSTFVQDGFCLFPQWSPDGKQLLYTVFNGDMEEVPGFLKTFDLQTSSTALWSGTAHKGFWKR